MALLSRFLIVVNAAGIRADGLIHYTYLRVLQNGHLAPSQARAELLLAPCVKTTTIFDQRLDRSAAGMAEMASRRLVAIAAARRRNGHA